MGDGVLRAEEDALQVGAQDVVPLFLAGVFHTLRDVVSRVVDQNVEPTEYLKEVSYFKRAGRGRALLV